MYKNYSLKSKNGRFYRSSKEQSDEFKIQAKDRDGNIFWHDEQNTVSGTLVGMRISKPPFGGKQFSITLKQDDIYNVIQFNVFSDKSKIDGWARAFCYTLDSLERDEEYTFSLNQTNKDDGGYLYKNVYVRQGEDKVSWAIDPKDFPEGVKIKDPVTDEETVDYTARNKYFYDILLRNAERFAPKEKEEVVEEKTAIPKPDSDLPF
jgi:hypothetical protein